ncbi:MAG: hypothetical protein RLY93_11785 [Sumerlaeia bacterium]
MLRIFFIAMASLLIVQTTTAQSFFPIDAPDDALVQVTENRRNAGQLTTIALADLDDDGIQDLIMGAPRSSAFVDVNDNPTTVTDSGMVYVLFGDNIGSGTEIYQDLTAQPSLEPNALRSSLVSGMNGMQISPNAPGEFFGAALATGDFDGDGRQDLAVSATAPVGGMNGAVVLLLDTATLFAGSATPHFLDLENDTPTTGSAVRIEGREAGARFGSSLLMKDLDNDGLDDLIIGTPRASEYRVDADILPDDVTGTVDIVWGTTETLTVWGFDEDEAVSIDDLSPNDGVTSPAIQTIPQAHTLYTLPEGSLPHERFGTALAAADIDEISPPTTNTITLAVGAPNALANGAGQVRLIRLFQRPFTEGTNVTALASPAVTHIFRGTEDDGALGTALAWGDFQDDGLLDLVASAPFATARGNDNGGFVYIAPDIAAIAPTDVVIDAARDLAIAGAEDLAFLGMSLAIGEYDPSPGDDLIVGSPGRAWEDPFSTVTLVNNGAVYVFSDANLTAAFGSADPEWFADPGFDLARRPALSSTLLSGTPNNFRFGTRVAAGQFDNLAGVDVFGASDGLLAIAIDCIGNTTDGGYLTCNTEREGLRILGVRSGSLPFNSGGTFPGIVPAAASAVWLEVE